jgi:hypothetical protein
LLGLPPLASDYDVEPVDFAEVETPHQNQYKRGGRD